MILSECCSPGQLLCASCLRAHEPKRPQIRKRVSILPKVVCPPFYSISVPLSPVSESR